MLAGAAALFAADRAVTSVHYAVDGGFAAVMRTDAGPMVVPVLFGTDAAAASFASFLASIPADVVARRVTYDLCGWCDNPRSAACHRPGYRTPPSPYAVARCPFVDPAMTGGAA
jgi:hypothetical protein